MSDLDIAIERAVQAARVATARDIVDKIRRHCTPSVEAYAQGGDHLIGAVADWIESPPEWVNASWVEQENNQ
jgi:hypothetical protein